MKVAEQDAKPWTLNSQEKTLKRWGKGEACVTSPESLSAGTWTRYQGPPGHTRVVHVAAIETAVFQS